MNWIELKQEVYKKYVDLSEVSAIFFRIRLFLIRKFGKFNYNYRYTPDRDHSLILHSDFTGSELNYNDWGAGQSWGRLHPTFPHQYADRSCINVGGGNLRLSNTYNPKDITQWEGQEMEETWKNVPFAHGEIHSKRKYFYGVYEMRCKVPYKPITAFWLAAYNIREIDMFEFFKKGNNKNHKHQLITVHWNDGGRKMTPKNYGLPLDITKNHHVYTFKWYPHKLEFLFDGVVVRRVTNKRLLRTLNIPMEFIIGNGIESDDPVINNPSALSLAKAGLTDDLVVNYIKHWKWEKVSPITDHNGNQILDSDGEKMYPSVNI